MDAIQQVAAKKLKAIKQLTNNSNIGNIKFLLKGKDINSLSPEIDFVLINKIFDTIKPKQTDIKERIYNILNDVLTEKLCPKGEAYRQRRLASGEKSSAYLSGRAVKVCKGLMTGKKSKVNESKINEGQKIIQNLDNLLNKMKKDFNIKDN
jgi:hypothetical protein